MASPPAVAHRPDDPNPRTLSQRFLGGQRSWGACTGNPIGLILRVVRWAALLLIAGSAACLANEDLTLPPHEGASHLLVVQAHGTSRVWAYEVDPPKAFSVREVEAYFLVSYAESLATLGFEPGEQLVDGSGRALPRWSRVQRRSPEDPAWRDDDGEALAGLRLDAKSDGECQGPNECWVRAGGEGWCRRDCPPLVAIAAPELPATSELPDLGPCASGWREVLTPFSDRAFRTCEPLELSCGAQEEAWLGDEACSSSTCPDWPVGSADLYVDPAASPNGDGSRGQPFTRLADALSVARPGATIALSAGEHAANDVNLAQVNLRGACAGRVHLRLPAGQALTLSSSTSLVGLTVSPAILVAGGSHALERVQVAADQGTALSLRPGARLTARQVRIRGARVGVNQAQGNLQFDQIDVEASWSGMILDGEATVRRARVEVPVQGRAALEAQGSLVLGESLIRGGLSGIRLRAATSTVQQSLIEGAWEGLQSYGGALVLSQVQVRRTGIGGLTIRDVGDDEVNYGPPQAQISDLYSHDSGAAGLAAVRGEFRVTRAAVHGATELGVLIGDGAAQVQDLSVWATSPRVTGINAGLAIGFSLAGGQLEASRVSLEDHAAYAFNAYSHGTAGPYELIMRDLLIRGVARRAETGSVVTRGHGLIFSSEGTAELTRARVYGTAEAALRVESGTTVGVSDLDVEACGYGFELLAAPSLRASKVAITNPDVGGLIGGGSAGSHFELSHVAIRDRRAPSVASRGFWLLPIFDEGSGRIEDFQVQGLLGEGLMVEGNWSVVLERGAFIDNALGVVHPAAGPLPLETEVTYRGNGGAVMTR